MEAQPAHAPRRTQGLARPMTRNIVVAALAAALFALLTGFHHQAFGATTSPVRLATAGSYAVLAGSTITNTGLSTISGDVGLHPGTSVTGFAPCTAPAPADCVALTGSLHLADGAALQAKNDLLTATNDLLTLEGSCTPLSSVELAGKTFLPGVYCSPTFELSAGGILTLDAGNVADAEFIFLTGSGGSTLITGAATQVRLINGAEACNVYFQVASSATIGVGSAFAGNILAAQSITVQQGVTLEGRALAQTAAVTLDTNTITKADCVVPTTTTAPASTTTSLATTTTAPASTTTSLATTTTAPASTTTSLATTTTAPASTTTGLTTTTARASTTTTAPAATTTTRALVAGESGSQTAGGQAEAGAATSSARSVQANGGRGSLARTGTAVLRKVLFALVAIGLGTVLLLPMRRRRRPTGPRSGGRG
ncbi:MAG: ice-binding family protein [Acidimicrobiales bacterium]